MDAKLHPGTRGDRLEATAPGGGPPRRGVIAEVMGGPGHEHYVVEWNDGHRSIHYPADGTRIVPAAHRRVSAGSVSVTTAASGAPESPR